MLYGFGVVLDAACNSEAKVDSVLKNKAWVWKPPRSELRAKVDTVEW